MTSPSRFDREDERVQTPARGNGRDAVDPQCFSGAPPRHAAIQHYLNDPATRKLADFFEAKGLATLKQEDLREQWYADWIEYQADHQIYASVVSPKAYSTVGGEFDVLRYARFLEVFAYFSPAHGYSLQVTFLGLYSILMGCNAELKREAVAAIEGGGLLALGVSEQRHGSDLLANTFALTSNGNGQLIANGTKCYIGNSNVAVIVSILGLESNHTSAGRAKRAVPVLFALRPKSASGFKDLRKIRTFGVRAAHVGEFQVKDHELPQTDVIAKGRDAWDAVLGTVTLGKFFLGFGSIGICEHAFQEARDHLRGRILYGKPAIEMPHIRSMMAQAYARLTAMKLYAYRALDYLHAACADDRRCLLFCAVQKAKVSTEGVRLVASLSECVGAKGFEGDTYLEMALRDAQLIPGLEGSAHINLALTAQFIPRYFNKFDRALMPPASLVAGEADAAENPHLTAARTTGINTIAFSHFLQAFIPLLRIPNARRFARQARAFRRFLRRGGPHRFDGTDTQIALALGQCMATIAYAQLIAENAHRLEVAPEMISTIFHLLVADLSGAALALASLPQFDAAERVLLRRMVNVPTTTRAEWDSVCARMDSM